MLHLLSGQQRGREEKHFFNASDAIVSLGMKLIREACGNVEDFTDWASWQITI